MQPPLGSLAAHWHACKGQIPPPLVGASATLVDSGPGSGDAGQGKLYLFGGRLVSTRRMVNDLYQLDLGSLVWTKLSSPSSSAAGGPTSPREDVSSRPSSSRPSSSGNASSPTQPQARYFHSADLWQGRLVVFGGMGYASPSSPNRSSQSQSASPDPKPDDLCVLDQIIAYDLTTGTWDLNFGRSARSEAQHPLNVSPAPRYAHLSAVTAGTLIIIGGQNMANQYVEEISIFDLETRRWVGAHAFPKQCGSYRSLAVAGRWKVDAGDASPLPAQKRPREASVSHSIDTRDSRGRASSVSTALSSTTYSTSGKASSNGTGYVSTVSTPTTPMGTRLDDKSVTSSGNAVAGPSSASNPRLIPVHKLPSSSKPTDDDPLPIYVYSNFNFTSVNRQLGVVKVSRNGKNKAADEEREVSNGAAVREDVVEGSSPSSLWGVSVDIEDRSAQMEGPALPPGLRFPTGSILGSYLIISGTYLANTSQTFSIWALHLPTLSWTRLDPGQLLTSGSWNRAILWPRRNQLLVAGHRDRNLVDDYNHRQTNWDHVVLLELEAWGIYQPPVQALSDEAVELGLEKLAAASQGSWLTSFELGGGSVAATQQASDAEGVVLAGKVPLPNAPLALGGRGDFELIGSDGVRLGCDRTVLEARWPWFQHRVSEWTLTAREKARSHVNWMASAAFMPESVVRGGGVIESKVAEVEWGRRNEALQVLLEGEDAEQREEVRMDDEEGSEESESEEATRAGGRRDRRPSHMSNTSDSAVTARGSSRHDARRPPPMVTSSCTSSHLHDPRLTPRVLVMAEPSPVLLAFLQFLYTRTLCTSLQRHPAMLASLLVLSVTYDLPELGLWVRHAAHTILGRDLAPPGVPQTPTTAESAVENVLQNQQAAAVAEGPSPEERHRLASLLAETAALTGEGALQLRALRTSMLAAKWAQRVAQSAAAAAAAATEEAREAESGQDGSSIMVRQSSAAIPGSALSPHSQSSYTPGHAHAYQDAHVQEGSAYASGSTFTQRSAHSPARAQGPAQRLSPAEPDQRLRSSSDPRWGGGGGSSSAAGGVGLGLGVGGSEGGVSSEDESGSSNAAFPSHMNVRRPSNKAERMLGLSGAEAAAAGLGAGAGAGTGAGADESGRSRAPPPSARGAAQAQAQTQAPRRQPPTATNASPLHSQPPSAASSRGASPSVPRKRFSIFGRTSAGPAPAAAPVGAGTLAGEMGALSVRDEEETTVPRGRGTDVRYQRGTDDDEAAAANTTRPNASAGSTTPTPPTTSHPANGHAAEGPAGGGAPTPPPAQTQSQSQSKAAAPSPAPHLAATPIVRGTVASKIQALQQQVLAANGSAGTGGGASNGMGGMGGHGKGASAAGRAGT